VKKSFALALVLSFAVVQPAWSFGMGSSDRSMSDNNRDQASQERDSGNCCSDSHDDMRNSVRYEHARQRAVRNAKEKPNDGGWGSNQRRINHSADSHSHQDRGSSSNNISGNSYNSRYENGH
jgi:hypothetical protein